MQTKIPSIAAALIEVGLIIHKSKCKFLKYNTMSINKTEALEVSTFLGSIADNPGGSDEDRKAQIQKASATFLQLKNI